MRNLWRNTGVAVVLMLVAACGKSGGSTGPSFDLTGNYRGTETFTTGPGAGQTVSLSATLIQSGSSLAGSYANGAGDRGSISATLSGSTFQGTATSALLPGPCIFKGSTDGNTLTGTVACTNIGSGATINLTRV